MPVAVIGAAGRMGAAVCAALDGSDDLELVATVDLGDNLDSIARAGAVVAVDFTTPDVVMDHLEWGIAAGVHMVVGTTGFGDERLDAVLGMLAQNPGVGVVIAPNFSIGAVLLMRFAAEAARYFESVEIIELHHPDKLDAPSGTARHTAEMIGRARLDARRAPMPDATRDSDVGARGARIGGVPVHSLRLRGLIAHEEVLLGNAGEVLTLRHDSMDRVSFMPGVLLAVRAVASRRGLTVGLENLLD
jgi:4-hydroxy-tetrahydrodipicolinate reductase